MSGYYLRSNFVCYTKYCMVYQNFYLHVCYHTFYILHAMILLTILNNYVCVEIGKNLINDWYTMNWNLNSFSHNLKAIVWLKFAVSSSMGPIFCYIKTGMNDACK